MSRPASRRLLLQGALVACALPWLGGARGQSPRTVQMTARRFAYEPAEIPLRAGEPVIVEIRSVDFVHGMNIPDLQMRLDLVPGRVNRLEFTPTAPGVIDFVCDNFCGDGHEAMHGRFVVTA